MKGKNKDQHHHNQKDPSSQSLVKISDNQLSFPDVTPLDHVKLCPRYTSILNRPDGDGVGIEEINSLQMEIERLLVNVVQRNRLLNIETKALDNDKNSDSNPIPQKSISMPLQTSCLVDKSSSGSISKRQKSFSGKPNPPLITSTSSSLIKSSNSLFLAEPVAPLVRNEIPDVFWQSVEPYCADLTEDDLKYLESQIDLSDKYSTSFTKIGQLGKHYTLQWAEEDMNQQIKEGSRFFDLDSKSTPSSGYKRKASVSSELTPTSYFLKKQSLIEESLEKLNKNQQHQQQNDTLNYGPLTQRLISALIEQNLMTPFDNEINDYLDKIGPPQSSYMSPKTMAKKFTFSTHNTSNIERKIKKTLIEQGILELDENDKVDLMSDDNSQQSGADVAMGVRQNQDQDQVVISKDDEIANEILNVQNELRLVSKQCKQTLEQLMGISRQNLMRQDVKKKIAQIDLEIIDFYDKFKNARLAKKLIIKRDKEKAQRLIKEREMLKTQLKKM